MSAAAARYWPNAFVAVERDRFEAIGVLRRGHPARLDPILLDVLESFVARPEATDAYAAYCRMDAGAHNGKVAALVRAARQRATRLVIQIAGDRLRLYHDRSTPACPPFLSLDLQTTTLARPIDLTPLSRGAFVLQALRHGTCESGETRRSITYDEFRAHIETLCELGCLGPQPAPLAPDDPRLRTTPLCSLFGLSRGTPVDRRYLHVFMEEARPHISGRVLEIGGSSANRALHRLPAVSSYQTLDIASHTDADVIGDAHDRSLFPPGSFDSVLALNVLEHCEEPRRVVENARTWLRPEGVFCCMVPSSQRVHRAPKDYWRLLPDALESLTSGFRERRILVYGNLATSIASLMGMAAEEVPAEHFDWHDPRYPVATCAIARK